MRLDCSQPKSNQNQNNIVKKHLRINNSHASKANCNQNQIVKKHLKLNNSPPTKSRSQSESNCQKTSKTEQLTIYQSKNITTIKL